MMNNVRAKHQHVSIVIVSMFAMMMFALSSEHHYASVKPQRATSMAS